ncbi:MAG: hypothetical protein OEY86_10960, partial [Nitrospira sp.]|nr:hypothetical protein [Nitrospira sp.]
IRRAEGASSLPYRPFSPVLDLRSDLASPRPFGSCRSEVVRAGEAGSITVIFHEGGTGWCGQRLGIQPDGRLLDALSYRVLRIRGQAIGHVTLAVEDWAATRREDNLLLATVTGTFDLTMALSDLGRRADLRRLAALVVMTQDASAQVVLEQVELMQEPSPVLHPKQTGFWVWNYHKALADPGAVLAACKRQGCTRVLLQMPTLLEDDAIWTAYGRFFMSAKQAGIEAMALDGAPDSILEPQRLAGKIRKVLALVESSALAGIQLDIEPYLLPGFFSDESGSHRYLDAIDVFRDTIGGRTRLSIVVPFWLTGKTVGGRPLGFAVMDRADDVAVMSYRTSLEELEGIADDTLRYGELIGTPVWLAVETTALPVERRVMLTRASGPELADAAFDYDSHRLDLAPLSPPLDGHRRDWFRVHHRLTVRPERLTFAGQSRSAVTAAVQALQHTVSPRSFAGVLIHDLDGFQALAE